MIKENMVKQCIRLTFKENTDVNQEFKDLIKAFLTDIDKTHVKGEIDYISVNMCGDDINLSVELVQENLKGGKDD